MRVFATWMLLLMCACGWAQAQDNALFFRSDAAAPEAEQLDAQESAAVRSSRQAQTDQTVRSILEWIQERYSGGKKTARQSDIDNDSEEPSRAYLPVEEPRPFQTPEPEQGGYPYERPNPPFQPSTGRPSATYDTPPPSYETVRPPKPAFSTPKPVYTTQKPVYTTQKPVYTTQRPVYTTQKPVYTTEQQTYRPPQVTNRPVTSTGRPTYVSSTVSSSEEGGSSEEHNELAHPPHIHNIDVQCAKDMMTINIEFNRQFDGVIYSKGFYSQTSCRYVQPNSGQTKYSFTVNLNSCGTQFIERFQESGQAYLENVLVLQNEAGIQEVWDTIRRVRCLWEGNINQALTVGLSVDMLTQEIVTFSGDTAVARLEIQAGKGPFAAAANGLVKIGEIMTLVVSVEGDPGFDIQVRDCVARDDSSENVVKLTDERGCVLKPKLMGAFQKTRDTGNTGASIIAYAFFQAFKFPDIMDLTLDCNVELCKTDCEMCPDPNQNIDPSKRRRRDVSAVDNSTIGEPVRVFRSFRIVAAEDFEAPSEALVIGDVPQGVCLSLPGLLLASSLLVSLLMVSVSVTACLYLKSQRNHKGSGL